MARRACEAKDAFHLLFIHADTGGHNLSQTLPQRARAYCSAMEALCAWPAARCVTIAPRHETEAWVLGDSNAVMSALGYAGSAQSPGLPDSAGTAERLPDPKAILTQVIRQVRGPRRRLDPKQIFAAVAQLQKLAGLRSAQSFLAFEAAVAAALLDLGCIAPSG